MRKVRLAPVWTGHADFCNPFEFLTFMRTAADLEFDVMLESKAKDLAVTRLAGHVALCRRRGIPLRSHRRSAASSSEQAALLEQDAAADV